MKKLILIAGLFMAILPNAKGQEKFGNTLNLGLGLGYYGYAPFNTIALHANYEFDVAKDFTLAPFITYSSYRRDYYWGNNNYPYRYYSYRQTVVPIGVKGTYYFDDAFNAGSKWDFYGAASLGFAIVRSRWEDGYPGDKNVYRYRSFYGGTTPLYLDLHLGAEYHFNSKIGMFLDLSTGITTLGVAIH